MNYFGQLRLLLHHKICLRRRQPIILALEFFWPALVFATVYFIRLQFPPENRPTCYYDPKSLPSAGPLNFIQSLVCTIDNPCIKDESSYQEVPTFPEARIHNLMTFLAPLMEEEKIRTFISDLPKSMSLASSIVDALVQPEMISVFEAGIPLNEIVKEIDFQKLAIGDGHSSFPSTSSLTSAGRSPSVTLSREEVPKIVQGIKEASKIAAPTIKILVHNFSSILNLEEDLNQLDLTGNGTDLLGSSSTATIIAKMLCGKPLASLSSEFQLLKAAKGLKKPKINQAELDSISSKFCRKGYKQIMQMEGGPVIWAFLKPIFSGKILYAPNNSITKQIIGKMNKMVHFLTEFKKTLESWTKTMSSLEAFYNSSDANIRIQTVQVVVDFIHQNLPGVADDMDAKKLMKKLDSSGGLLGLVQFVSDVTQCFELERFVGFHDESGLEEAAKSLTKSHELIAGLVFLNVSGKEEIPRNIHYKIRADIDFVPTTKMLKERMWEPGARADFFRELGYQQGFVQVQELVDRAIAMTHLNSTTLTIAPSVLLQQIPYQCYKDDKFALYMRALTPVVATMSWIFLIAFMIRDMVLDRELHLEEMLRVLGLRPSVAWITWFSIGFTAMSFGSFCALAILKLAGLTPYSNFFVLYSYFMCFAYSVLMYCYMMSSFFKTATIASLSGIVAYLATYLPFMVAITLEYDMTFMDKILSCFSMSTSFCFGMMYMSRYEAQGLGMHWSNAWSSPMADDPMSFAWAAFMMIIDGSIYFLVGWYVSNVFPAGNSVHAQPWYFFLLPRYWNCCGGTSPDSGNKVPHVKGNFALDTAFMESSAWQRRPGMSIEKLHIIYNKGSKRERIAVSDLNLELKEGQITTLLGRNGAGKTSTLNVLTGQLAPTSGSVFVYGHQVPQEFSEARKLLGYCPQYNTLFKELTVREHLIFYSSLKNLLPDEEIDSDVDSMLHMTNLWSIQNEQAKNLSGGLQRRLCVALAFVGGSKLIILDEPTSSVDPVARRNIWDLIVQQKQSRTVLLTTHHMDEADILSDQVAVIHKGKLLCNGSPLLLRSKFGCGYQLTVSRQGQGTEENSNGDSDSGRASNEFPDDTNDSEKLLSFTKCLIPNAALVEEFSSEVVLSLPYEDADGQVHDYATFFRCLDANLVGLGYGSYGLTSSTLEDVFLSLCGEEVSEEADVTTNLAIKDTGELCGDAAVSEIRRQYDQAFNNFDWSAPSLESGFTLKLKQMKGLLLKRYQHTVNDWKTLFSNLILPCMFIALAMAMTLIKPSFAPDPILPLHPNIYGKGATSFFSAKGVMNTNTSLSSLVMEVTHLKQKDLNCVTPRQGWKVAKCPIIKGAKHDESVYMPKHLKTLTDYRFLISEQGYCRCQDTPQHSLVAMYPQLVPEPQKSGAGYMFNLTGWNNTSDFLLRTFSVFNDRRYGGFSFHPKSKQLGREADVAKVWFDNNGFHAMAAYLSSLNEGIMKANLRISGIDPDEYSITTYSHPFHLRSSQIGDQTIMQRGGDAGIALIILVGFIFIPTSFVFYIVSERVSEEKQLQKIFGVGPILYWISSMTWDLIMLSTAVAISGAIIICFQMPIYTSRLNLPGVLLLVFLFGWAMTSLVYLMEKLFDEPSIAFMVIYCLALFVGINTMVIRLLIDVFELVQVSPLFKAFFEQLCLVMPPYALMSGLVDITRNQLFSEIYTLFDQDVYVSPFSMDLLGPHYITLASEGVIFFLLNLIIELTANWSFRCGTDKTQEPAQGEDSDVSEERRRVIQDQSSRFDVMRVINVSKVFQSMFGKRTAVDHISFAVPRGECFGLLGVNGAGKTTLFKMLTGQMKPTSGKTIINRMSINELLSGSCQFLGYCPQGDALDSVLSPREHLSIYSELRGVPSLHISRVVSDSLLKFQLSSHSDVPVRNLSRGTKRKLCLAIAMLGSPQIVLLDEPTSGMDPMSRRCLWNNIQSAVRDRRSVLLTSHTMEECDILCSRLAIMVNGRFQCIGSPQYLKYKFGAGYMVTLRLSDGIQNWNEAIAFMQQSFTACTLRAHHHNMLEFSLPAKDLPLSSIFSHLQSAKDNLQLQNFSVSQTTLDQVFVSFANKQVNDYPCDLKVVKEGEKLAKKVEQKEEEPKQPGSRKKVYQNMAFKGSSNSITDITYSGQQQKKGQSHRVMVAPLPHHHQYQHYHNHSKSSKHSHPMNHELKLVRTTKF